MNFLLTCCPQILSMSIDEPEFFQQETEASEIQTAEQRLKVDMAPKLCDLHQCDGTSTCSINCQRHIFW